MFEHLHQAMTPFLNLLSDNRYIHALAVIVLSLVVATAFKFILIAAVKGFNKSADNRFDGGFLTLLQTPIYFSLFIIGCTLAVQILAPADIYSHFTSSILATIAILIWSVFFLRANHMLLLKVALNPNRFHVINNKTLPLFLNLLNIIIIVLAVYFVFTVWGVDMTAWLASAGIVGIAVGFAAKDTLANLFSGVFIMADAPYEIGDYVVLDTGERGEITHIGMRSTRMLTRDDIEVTIPNSVMGNTKIINESGGHHEKSRCSIPIGVAYDANIDQVREVLMQVALSEKELVCAEPEPRVRFRRFGPSALEFELLLWIEKPVLRGRVIDTINCEIYKQFHQRKIEIPYSKHDLYIKEMPNNKNDNSD
ncbi:mechanosensitive ion channel family protein [uncultured Paraglaciecola sp.]|uniref:mechanosensitive ion channel family protein n=1 Tax=uncultured Paraglaciecola sp. TaxID=1765024 RepID=UPI0026391873|nr:mechanosensitive ion channel family protein [uncultured Paraglaciecola sp.]